MFIKSIFCDKMGAVEEEMGVDEMAGQIHKFKIFNKNIILDVNSGSVYTVDDLVFDVLDLYYKNPREEIMKSLKKKYNQEEIEEAIGEIEQLIKQDILFSDADFGFVWENLNERDYVKALCLNVAHDCNLRCKYCFASKGDYQGKRELMTKRVGREAVDFLIQNSGHITHLEIDFFGGEPLLAYDTVREVVNYARSKEKDSGKKFHFTMTTNGVLLKDDVLEYLHENMDNVVLSIDGRKKVNDRIRVRVDGSGSYDIIINNIKKMVELRERDRKEYYVRGTFTKDNLDFSEDVLHLADQGFSRISIEPVVGVDGDFLLDDGDVEKIYEEYDKIAREYLKRKQSGQKTFRFYHFNVNIYHGPCIYKRLNACGAGRDYLAVTPSGEIYPCHQFVGNNEFLMGNVQDKKIDERIIKRFKDTHVFSKKECRDCWARFFCSGGCNANNFLINGDLNQPYDITCKLQKKRIEYAIYLSIMEKGKFKEHVNTMC